MDFTFNITVNYHVRASSPTEERNNATLCTVVPTARLRACQGNHGRRETFPRAFDAWEKNAENERAAAKRDGVNIIPVFLDPDEFFTFCKEKKIPPNSVTAAAFVSSRGAASYSMGL